MANDFEMAFGSPSYVVQAASESLSQEAIAHGIDLHRQSSKRNDEDIAGANDAMVRVDRPTITTMQSIIGSDQDALGKFRSGDHDGFIKAMKKGRHLHRRATQLDQADMETDVQAIQFDKDDRVQQIGTIADDQQLLKTGVLPQEATPILSTDINSKGLLRHNDEIDIPNEQRYYSDDQADIAINDRIAQRLKGANIDPMQLSADVQSDIESKRRIIGNRREDLAKEPRYIEADTRDSAINRQYEAIMQSMQDQHPKR
ncbi:MAG: hypothetical protein ACRD3W_21555 [Terriglobales bacterium]